MPGAKLWAKMIGSYVSPSPTYLLPQTLPFQTIPVSDQPHRGVVLCIGGPALIYYVTPTEEELVSRYNPELRARSLANREGKQEEFNAFVTQLKEYSRSDKPIWVLQQEERAQKRKDAVVREEERLMEEKRMAERREEIRRSAREG